MAIDAQEIALQLADPLQHLFSFGGHLFSKKYKLQRARQEYRLLIIAGLQVIGFLKTVLLVRIS